MNTRLTISLMLILFLPAACSRKNNVQNDAEKQVSVSPHQSTIKETTAEEFDSVRRMALAGDANAAGRLMTIYEECSLPNQGAQSQSPKSDACDREFMRWLQIAAENGDIGAMSIRANQELQSGSCYGAHRATFWLDRILSRTRREPWISLRRDAEHAQRQCNLNETID